MADLLVVDDDQDLASLIECILLDEGHTVRVAHDGRQGLASVLTKTPELVVMDVEMPLLTGPGMVERLFVANLGRENIPIVLVSGVEGLAKVASSVGTPYFLAKPFTVQALVALLNRALQERTPPRPAF